MEIRDESLKDFLIETHFCDFKNSNILEVANQIKSNCSNEKELAIKLFEFVRDEIKYTIGPWNKKASETLNEKIGMCTTNTNLLVALFRAVGIPAGYCIYKVVGGESFGHLVPKLIKKRIHRHSVHIVCSVFLNNQWIKCDPSTDKELSINSKHISRLTELINWDGEHDSVPNMDASHIISIGEPLANIDYQMQKKPRYIVRNHLFHIGNLYIDFLRSEGKNIKTKDEVEKSFVDWIKRHHRIRFLRYKLIYYFYELGFILLFSFKKKWKKIKN